MSAIVALAVASGVLFVHKIKPPLDAANAYTSDLAHHRYTRAFDRLCARSRTDRAPSDLETFVASVDMREFDVFPFDVNVHGDRATVKVRVSDNRYFRLRLEDVDGWRPCGGVFGFVRSSS